MKGRRVVITGIGIVSPLGNTRETTWKALLQSKSGAGPITQFDATTWPVKIACEVKDFSLPPESSVADLSPYLNRPSEFGMAAAWEAMLDSGLSAYDRTRFGISIGASIGAISPHQLAKMLSGMQVQEGLPTLSATVEQALAEQELVLKNHPATLAALLCARWGAMGPVTTIHTACASSGQSIGHAADYIRRGEADVMLAGGADSLAGELLLAGFCLLGALSKRNAAPTEASRPFDKDRDGFVASEGAAMLVLETLESARDRGAKIYGEIAGYGETQSAYRITDLPEDGRGVTEAMELALQGAGLSLGDITYINTHGTSTELNDRVEAMSVRRLFYDAGFSPWLTSTKSSVGHLISAAGAIEAAFSALSLRDQIIPPTLNLHKTDCGQELRFVSGTCLAAPVRAVLSNSVGFGGTNAVLALREVTP